MQDTLTETNHLNEVQRWYEQRRAARDAAKAKTPEVGDLGTYGIGSDCYGVVVTKVTRNGKTVEVMDLDYFFDRNGADAELVKRLEEAEPQALADAKARVLATNLAELDEHFWTRSTKFTLRGNGRYRLIGCNYGGLSLGYPEDYRDPSF